MSQVFPFAAYVPQTSEGDFDTVLRAQLSAPGHRLAELNSELVRVGPHAPAALPLLIEAAACYGRENDFETQSCYAKAAYACAESWGDPVSLAEAGTSVAVACCWTGDLRKAAEHADEVATYLDTLDDAAVRRLLSTLADLSWVEMQLRRLREAQAHQRRGLRIAEAAFDVDRTILFRVLLGATSREDGRLGDAIRHVHRAREIAEGHGKPVCRGLVLAAQSAIAFESGDPARSRELAEEARREAGAHPRFAAVGMVLGLSLIATGRPREGRDQLIDAAGGRALPLAPAMARARLLAALAAADAELGNQAEAERWSELAMASTSTQYHDHPLGWAHLARAEALSRSDPASARPAADAARMAFERAGARLGEAAAWSLLGTVQGRLGRTSDSLVAFARSEELYRSCAATAAADHVRLLRTSAQTAAEVTAEAERAVRAVVGSLSPREKQVARLIAEGSSNQQIASVLDIKLNTVQVHVGRILRKLRVRSRSAVARVMTLAETTDLAVAAGGRN